MNSMSLPSIQEAIETYDGRHTGVLQSFVEQPSKSDMRAALEYLNGETAHQEAATWLLLQWAKSGRSPSPDQLDTYVEAAVRFETWAAKLHLSQSVEHLQLNPKQAHALYPLLLTWVEDSQKFLRAWSLSALASIAKGETSVQPDIQSLLERALSDPAASVRARARKLLD